LELICVDCGYGDTKVKTIDKLYKFSTKIQPAMSNDGNIIMHDRICYQVGTGHDEIIVDNKYDAFISEMPSPLSDNRGRLYIR